MTRMQVSSKPTPWLFEHWPKATVFLALYTVVLLFLYLFDRNPLLFLIWIQTPIYWLHQFEEYVVPGGFGAFFNRTLLNSPRSDWPVTPAFSFWINIPIIWIAFPLSAILAGGVGLAWGIWTVYFSILNAASHVVMAVRFGYNPGFGVSLLLNIPVGVFALITFIQQGAVTVGEHIVGIAIALLVQGLLMAWGLGVMRRQVREHSPFNES